ncbi:hypothetical protein [Chroococcidiopsis cubana]|nr:hypothetical protein [Chroococcidiopsis cubana]
MGSAPEVLSSAKAASVEKCALMVTQVTESIAEAVKQEFLVLQSLDIS